MLQVLIKYFGLLFGNPFGKSSEILSKGFIGVGSGCNSPCGLDHGLFTFYHTSHDLTNLATSLFVTLFLSELDYIICHIPFTPG
jgi:hypothetical protein